MTVQAFLYFFVLILHFLSAALLVGVILLQGGKGASMAASFAGSGASAFGTRTDEVMLRATRWCAGIFLCTSVGLTILSERATSTIQQASSTTFVERGSDFAAPPAVPAAPAPPSAGATGGAETSP
jgi:preprotein translocase subunit SecG